MLAGGCATGTYYRAGEGLVGSWLALIFYAGFAAIMKTGPLKPLNDGLRSRTVDAVTLPQTFGISPWFFVAALTIVVALLVRRHLRRERPMVSLPPKRRGLAHVLFEKRWHAFVTAVVIGVIATVAWPLSAASGRNDGLGITTPSANLVSFLTTGNVAKVDWGVLLVLGILVGSFIAARASGEFRVRVPDATIAVRSMAAPTAQPVAA